MKTSILKPEAKNGLNLSLKSEYTTSHTYTQLANYMQRLGLFGFEKFFRSESEDELKHAKILIDYANDMGDVLNVPTIEAIQEFPQDGGEALDIAYQMELNLMNQYGKIYSDIEENDPVTAQFLLQFLEIQRKSVGEYGDLIAKYDIAKRTNEILLFDEQLAD